MCNANFVRKIEKLFPDTTVSINIKDHYDDDYDDCEHTINMRIADTTIWIDIEGTVSAFANCCGIGILNTIIVSAPIIDIEKKEKLLDIFIQVVEAASRRHFKYGVLLYADRRKRKDIISGLERANWEISNAFTNPKTSNKLVIYSKVLINFKRISFSSYVSN